MEKDPQFFHEHIRQIEFIAEDVLTDRREIIELNKKKEKCREAIRALKTTTIEPDDGPTWLCCGNLFIAMDKDKATSSIEKDKAKFESEIDTLHKSLKKKVYKLYDAEHKPELKGFDLVPFNKEEKRSLYEIIDKE